MRNPILKRDVGRGMHGIMVVCHNLLSCGTLVSLVFGTAIPTSFSIFNENVFTLVSLKCNLEANAIAYYSLTLIQLQPALSTYAITVLLGHLLEAKRLVWCQLRSKTLLH